MLFFFFLSFLTIFSCNLQDTCTNIHTCKLMRPHSVLLLKVTKFALISQSTSFILLSSSFFLFSFVTITLFYIRCNTTKCRRVHAHSHARTQRSSGVLRTHTLISNGQGRIIYVEDACFPFIFSFTIVEETLIQDFHFSPKLLDIITIRCLFSFSNSTNSSQKSNHNFLTTNLFHFLSFLRSFGLLSFYLVNKVNS